MRRKALLIGNADPKLPGVRKDIANWKDFLLSDVGGAWINQEIDECVNYSTIRLLLKIKCCKREKYDFVLVVFSGHGNYWEGTNLIINSNRESISESVLNNIATRQINVFDCCRYGYIEKTKIASTQLFEFIAGSTRSSQIRALYEERMMSAPEQQVNLYACSIGQYAEETQERGGDYIYNLLQLAREFNNYEPFKTVNRVHRETLVLLKDEQIPEIVCNPEYHNEKNQLILSINPDIIIY